MISSWKRRPPIAPVEAIQGLDRLWTVERVSVYNTIAGALASGIGTHDAVRAILPDKGSNEIRYAPGLKDALLDASDVATPDAHSIAAAVCKVLREPTAENAAQLLKLLCDCNALSIIDDALLRILKEVGTEQRPLAAFARLLVLKSPELEPIKVAIALLGVSGTSDDAVLISTAGCYDEFSLFAANALVNLLPEPDQELWALAKRVHGWGRIRVVERLAETTDENIKAWMLREGFRNSIMNEYLAYLCAIKGGLRDEILATEVDDALILGASELLSAMIVGQPGTPIEEFPDGGTVCLAFLKHVNARGLIALETISAAIEIRKLIDNADRRESLRNKSGWTAAIVMNINSEVATLLRSDAARSLIEAALVSREDSVFSSGASLANYFGIDPWPWRFARQQDPARDPWHSQWYWLMWTDDPMRVEQVLGLARTQLNLSLIGSGPGTAIGLGAEYRDDNQLDFIIQDLARFPGAGWDLIRIALYGRTIRLRHMAVKALSAWGREAWPPDAVNEIAAAWHREPDNKLRMRLGDLANGRIRD